MDLSNFLDTEKLINNKQSIKKIFFYRICGTGMGAAACLLKEAGFDISGADQAFFPPMSTYLESTGIPCYELAELNDEFYQDFDLIVVGNSVPRLSDQARFIEGLGVPFTSFPALLGAFVLKDREVIGLAGTHGKTTTTYFLQQLFQKLGEDCGYLIGGILDDAPPSKIGKSKYFVIESDEYDSAYFQKISKFRLYQLNHMILTSLEFDHADIYDNVEQIEDEFRAAFKDMKGSVAYDSSYASSVKLSKEFKNINWMSYGENNLEITKQSSNETVFLLKHNDESFEFSTNVIGKHNILNLCGCIKILYSLGFEYENIKNAVKELGLVKRRQEERGTYKGTVVIDDFAHHPKAVTLTLEAIRSKYPNKKVITVFEPISATARSSIFQNEFYEALSLSDKVILATNPLKTTVKSSENLDTDKIVHDLNQKNIPAYNARTLDELRGKIDEFINGEDLLLILSNRTCLGLWESDFVESLT
jgi:UDP-N-acetylmuramate: L-alanyl-gamma-D-glutamyl-meso-diaminopimelate ligase